MIFCEEGIFFVLQLRQKHIDIRREICSKVLDRLYLISTCSCSSDSAIGPHAILHVYPSVGPNQVRLRYGPTRFLSRPSGPAVASIVRKVIDCGPALRVVLSLIGVTPAERRLVLPATLAKQKNPAFKGKTG
jgi:hypothetical protein